MKIENNIGWCDDTGNVDVGCDKVSPGCKNCWAFNAPPARVLRAKGVETWGPNGIRVEVNSLFNKLPKLNKVCVCDSCHQASHVSALNNAHGLSILGCQHCGEKTLRRIRFFAFDSTDWLDPKRPVERLARALDAIRLAPNVDTQLLTKRIENFEERLEQAQDWHFDHGDRNCTGWLQDWRKHGIPPNHIWLGVSVEDQKRADERIPLLLKTPAAVRFLSVEPLLERIDLVSGTYGGNGAGQVWDAFGNNAHCPHGEKPLDGPGIAWVIVGGESGKNRRDCGVEAIESVATQCIAAGVPVYVKQDHALLPGQQGRITNETWQLKQFPKQP